MKHGLISAVTLVAILLLTTAAGAANFDLSLVLQEESEMVYLGLPVNDKMIVTAGVGLYAQEQNVLGDSSYGEIDLSVGVRRYLDATAEIQPYIFGTYGHRLYFGDSDDTTYSDLTLGFGIEKRLSEDWAVTGDVGLIMKHRDYGTQFSNSTSTYTVLGLRYFFD